eukprot:c18712_g1_i1 orf=726-1691(-)
MVFLSPLILKSPLPQTQNPKPKHTHYIYISSSHHVCPLCVLAMALSFPHRLQGPYYNLKHDPEPFSLDAQEAPQQQHPSPHPVSLPSSLGTHPFSVLYPPSPRFIESLRFALSIICYMTVIFVVIVGLSMGILFFVYRPKVPRFSLQDFMLSQLNVTVLPIISNQTSESFRTDAPTISNLTSGSFSTLYYDISVKLQAVNPNKMLAVGYDSVKVDVVYLDEKIASESVPPFEQLRKNTTFLNLELRSSFGPLPEYIGNNLNADLEKNKIRFFVAVAVDAKIFLGYSKSLPFRVYSACSAQVSSPSRSGGSRLLNIHCKADR